MSPYNSELATYFDLIAPPSTPVGRCLALVMVLLHGSRVLSDTLSL